MPRWASRTGVLIAAYVAVVVAGALWLPHEWDWAVFDWLSDRHAPAFSDRVAIVDLPWDATDIVSDRYRVAAFVDGLVATKQQPAGVILDIEFGPCEYTPCVGPWAVARDALAASVRTAAAHFPVYATEEFEIDRDDAVAGALDQHDPKIYGALSGAAHTIFITIPGSDGLYYHECYPQVPVDDASGQTVGTENVWAMVDRVLMAREFVPGAPCDQSNVPDRLGPPLARTPPAVYELDAHRSFPAAADFTDRYVIVGTLSPAEHSHAGRFGPELLGWALSNALDRASPVAVETYYDTRPVNALLLVVVPAFSALAVLAFAALFFPLRRMRLARLRSALPWICAALACAAGFAIFGAFETWMYAFQREIYPQVTLIALGIVTASGLSGLRGYQILADEANAIDPGVTETYDYDVFISYAHDELPWVFEHVYLPLRDAVRPDGKKLSVFFDTSTIRTGTAWQTKLATAIDASRFVVPVYSESYFKRPYCRFEILRAHRKWIAAGEESRCVLPVMRGKPKIFATVNDIQALSLDDHPDLVAQIVAEITATIARESGSPASATSTY